MGNALPSPKTEKKSQYLEENGLKIGASGMQGWRIEMEDDHIVAVMPSQKDHTFLAIFDGHGGSGAAEYAAKHLIKHIEDTSEWKEYVSDGAVDNLELLNEALRKAFFNIDEDLKIFQKTQQDNKTMDTSGCTATTCMITPKYIICANAGDSRTVLGTDGNYKEMSHDHKPDDEEEYKRITAADGFVQNKRVDGDLAVSRAFGDFSFKCMDNLPPNKQRVSCEPDFEVHERLNDKDDILLLACDGLWDVFQNPEAINEVRRLYDLGEDNMVLIAEEMLDTSLSKGSRDNISAIVVQLPAAKIGSKESGGVTKIKNEREERRRIEIDEAEKRDQLRRSSNNN